MSSPPSHEPEIQTSRSSEESEQLRNLLDLVPKLESRVESIEKELSDTKQILGTAILQMIKKVKKLENKFMKRKREETENEEDAEDQDQDIPSQTDQGNNFATPEKSKDSGEAQAEQISPSTLEAAQILTNVASEGLRITSPSGSKSYQKKPKSSTTPPRFLQKRFNKKKGSNNTIEIGAKFLHDTIAAQRKFLTEQRYAAIRNKPPTISQLRNQMITYLKHVANKKHAELKSKSFEEIQIQVLYERYKKQEQTFMAIGSKEDERAVNKMNKQAAVKEKEQKAESVHEEVQEEEGDKKRKLGTRRKLKAKRRKYTSGLTREDDDLKMCLHIAPDKDKVIDVEILDHQYPIVEWNHITSQTNSIIPNQTL
ncbi:hypothetical protein Tco_0721054 [Tanacetum coccineum]